MRRKKSIEKLKEETREISRETRERLLGYITGALGVVAGFAWNEVIKGFIEYIYPIPKNSLLAKLAYAVAMTVIVVFITVYLSRILKQKEVE